MTTFAAAPPTQASENPSPPGRPSPVAGAGRARVEVVAGRSRVTACYATSPMKLLTPRSDRVRPGDATMPDAPSRSQPQPQHQHQSATLCVSGFGGGLLSGDHLSLDLEVGPGARAVLSTQASTKVFHANAGGGPAQQTLHARVRANAWLAVVPDPVVCFRDAEYRQEQRFHLDAGAGLVLLDTFTAGRLSHGDGERWAFRRYEARNRVWLGGVEVLHDALRLGDQPGSPDQPGEPNQSGPAASASLADPLVTGGFNAFATLFFVGSAADHPAVEAWEATVRGRRPGRGDALRVSAGRLGASPVRVARFAASGVEAIEAALREALALLPAVAGCAFQDRRF